MAQLSGIDMVRRTAGVAKKGWKPGGQKGKLHDELSIPRNDKIPAGRLEAATHSRDPEIKRDAIRAKTMKGWQKPGKHKSRREALYDHPKGD